MSKSALILAGFVCLYFGTAFWLSRPHGAAHAAWQALIVAARRRAQYWARDNLP